MVGLALDKVIVVFVLLASWACRLRPEASSVHYFPGAVEAAIHFGEKDVSTMWDVSIGFFDCLPMEISGICDSASLLPIVDCQTYVALVGNGFVDPSCDNFIVDNQSPAFTG